MYINKHCFAIYISATLKNIIYEILHNNLCINVYCTFH